MRLTICLLMTTSIMTLSRAFAYAPPDPENRLSTGEFSVDRCNGINAMTPEQCKLSPQYAYDGGAINATEMQWAIDNGFSIVTDLDCEPWGVIAACPCSCFEKGTHILSSLADSNQVSWVAVEDLSPQHQLYSVADDATLSRISLQKRNISYVTHGPEDIAIIDLTLSGKQHLAVTQKHAMLRADGVVVTAESLQVGQNLLDHAGNPTTVVAIKRRPANGDVYNFLLTSDNKKGHFAIAEDVIVGDLLWQNSLSDAIGRVALRQ